MAGAHRDRHRVARRSSVGKARSLPCKATAAQWDAHRDLDWSIDVDPYATQVFADDELRRIAQRTKNGPFQGWDDERWAVYGAEMQRYTVSQFLHGEQLALVGTAKIIETVPDMDARLLASTQVVDEARHVDVFSRYLHDKLEGPYPISPHFEALFTDVITDPRWDLTYLGVQVMVEGLALSAFGYLQRTTREPLLKDLLRYVIADEARHVAFGVLALRDVYAGLSAPELRERQAFAFEAAQALSDRLVARDVFERLELPVERLVRGSVIAPSQRVMRAELFARIVPICGQLGLLDAGDGWLRDRFAEIGIVAPDAPAA